MTDQEKIIYDILCSDEQPPEGQHWEGFVTNKIIAALAQPEPEPLWIRNREGKLELYASPQREWQGLTDEEIKDILDCGRGGLVDIKKAEAKLKEKNAC